MKNTKTSADICRMCNEFITQVQVLYIAENNMFGFFPAQFLLGSMWIGRWTQDQKVWGLIPSVSHL